MIKNLNQLRRTLREGTQLEILDHCRPECIGQIRNITLVNTQGFYSTVANQPDASANRGNGGHSRSFGGAEPPTGSLQTVFAVFSTVNRSIRKKNWLCPSGYLKRRQHNGTEYF